MDIPKVKDFDLKTPIDIETPHGIVQLFPTRATRGAGTKKWCLAIEGVCRKKVESSEQCSVTFKGGSALGNFSKVQERNRLWLVTFETIIPAPEYWEES
jgi:hypothetical protein